MNVKQHSSMQSVTTSPWPRYVVDVAGWDRLASDLAAGTYTLLGLWGEHAQVHMAIFDPATTELAIATLPVPDGRFPSVAHRHLPALRMERTIADLFGFEVVGCPDPRPWLDHGKWPVKHPLAAHPTAGQAHAPYKFLPVEGEGIHQIPVGPIHAGIIEPGHFRFSANGETVVRLEELLGYMHRGVEKMFEDADLAKAAKLAGRISGDSTVAYAFAFARAVEAALGIEAPPRAQWLRAMMAEMERIANHFGDVGAVCNDAAFSLLHAHCNILREELAQLALSGFGHRFMMDCIVPGGVAVDPDETFRKKLRDWIDHAEKQFDAIVKVYDETASLKNRTDTTGFVREDLARQYGAGGFVGRASGRSFDTRRHVPYAPYDALDFEVIVLTTGDVNARVWVRVCEIRQSFALLRQILERLPNGKIMTPLPANVQEEREGMALVEGFRGDVLVWLRMEGGKIKRCYPRDPSWFQWPLLENCIKGNIVADFPLCNKSFNCSYSGHDG